MEQMGNLNNRYVWTDGEITFFFALIEEKNITAFLDGKQQLNSTIYLRERACYQKDTRSPGMGVVFRSNHLMETHLIGIYFLRTFQRFASPFRWKRD